MSLKVIAPTKINQCKIELPPSKSIANRVLILSALNGVLPDKVLKQPISTLCDDIRVMIEVLQSSHEILNVGAAGTAMRFATAYFSVSECTRVITGTARLQERPIGILVDALRMLGAHIEYIGKECFLPLRITGNTSMQGGALSLNGGISSQFISALLMIAPTLKEGLILKLEGEIVSLPYINITIGLMRQFGADVKWANERTIIVAHGYGYIVSAGYVNIEADWTAASYWYEIASIFKLTSPFSFAGLMKESLQGDSVCDAIFHEIEQYRDSNRLFKYDFTDCPDLVQTVVVTCCMNVVQFHFTGLRTLRIKETDRISALQTELAKLGYNLSSTNDSLSWTGSKSQILTSVPSIATYHDHRMAMSFAPCALRLGEIIIEDPYVVTKSYPTYWADLKKAGFGLCYI